MAPLNLAIGLQVLAVGQTIFGPAVVDDDVSQAMLTIDRTVSRGQTLGFNPQPASTRAELAIEQSNDGGATWALRAAAGIVGGLYSDSGTGSFNASVVGVTLAPGTGRRVRAVVVVAGDRVAVAGTLAVT